MRNIVFLLERFHLILLLLLLEGFAVFSLRKHYEYQDARVTSMSSSISGKVFTIRSGIYDYFGMKAENRRLSEENAMLLAKLEYVSQYPRDSTLPIESEVSTFQYKSAKIIENNITESINYIMLDKGVKDMINKGQGVITSNGVIGVITHVSENFSLAMSVISTKSRIGVRHKNSGALGNLTWDGINPFILSVDNVSKTNLVAVGDTFVTAGYSNFFPPNIPTAIVTSVETDPSTSFLYIDVKLSNAIDKVDYVFVVQSEDKPEIDSLLLNIPQIQ